MAAHFVSLFDVIWCYLLDCGYSSVLVCVGFCGCLAALRSIRGCLIWVAIICTCWLCGLLIVLFAFYSFYLWLLVCWDRLFSGLIDVVDCGFGVCGCLFVLLHVLCV